MPFITLSSPKDSATTGQTGRNDKKQQQPGSSSAVLKTLQPEIENSPMDLDCVEDSVDLKLVLEPTVDEFTLRDVGRKPEEAVSMDQTENKPDRSAPRRIQLITLSKSASK